MNLDSPYSINFTVFRDDAGELSGTLLAHSQKRFKTIQEVVDWCARHGVEFK